MKLSFPGCGMVSPETAGALLPRLFGRLIGSLFEVARSLAVSLALASTFAPIIPLWRAMAICGSCRVLDALAPSPRSRGEGGVRGFFDAFDSRKAPLTRPRSASVDLSPRAGRGKARRCHTLATHLLPGRNDHDRSGEIAPRRLRDAVAELFTQDSRLDFFDLALGKVRELERPERYPDQPVYLQADGAEDVANLAVLAFAYRERQPDIGPLGSIERCFDRPIMDAVDRQPRTQTVELILPDLAMRAHAIAPQPSGLR